MAERVAWVTGAGSGIGRGLAARLAKDGWRVAVSARSGGDLDQLAAETAGIHAFPLDVTDRAGAAGVVSRIEAEMGPIGLVVLNAGTYVPVSAKGFSAEKFGANFAVNVQGTANCLEAIMPVMRARRSGHIAVVSSLTGYVGLPTASGYGATKAALINMCEALEPELEAFGVKMTVINPGFVDTPLTRKNDFPMPFLISTDEAVERIVRGLRAGKFEIAFPLRMSVAIRLLAALPHWARLAVTRRMLPK
ncbi:SDR family NAD(P)-dependent oxidoreductase [Devosia sp. CN2-171]|uniref:SDR family NAD(P)-dependent oxidoreductase n=1 Tax=Devosia sp. CN2-171 TaxID=3400909 RepID=UPI003BF7EE2A